MLTTTKPCPSCGSTMTRERGVINEPCLTRFMRIVRRSRPVVFWACGTCEHCEEVTGSPKGGR